jgi:hypothetical protein
LCTVSPSVYSCLFPIFVQVYRPLSPLGNPTAVNKYRIVSYHTYLTEIKIKSTLRAGNVSCLREFESRVLRRTSEPKTADITGEWRRYSSPNVIRVIKSRRMRRAGRVARMGHRRGACRVLVGRPKVQRPRGRPRCRWEDNIKWISEKRDGSTDWIELAPDRSRWQ